jgi:hypothetical protein
MQGLELTFDTLAKTRNEAAVDVLISVLRDPETGIDPLAQPPRVLALRALTARSERAAAERLLAHWPSLHPCEIEFLRDRRSRMIPAVEAFLDRGGEEACLAIDAADALGLNEVLPTLIAMVHSSAAPILQRRAGDAVRRIIEPLGVSARHDRDRATVRSPLITQLAASIRACPEHCGGILGEAFLVACAWADVELQALLSESTSASERMARLLAETADTRVLELLTGFIRRREIPEMVRRVLASRDDECFRAALLLAIGCDPTQTVLRNLCELGMPQACRVEEERLKDLPIDCRASLIHAHTACNPDLVQTLNLAAATAELGTRDGLTAAAVALSRCEVPRAEVWIHAALRTDVSQATSQDERDSFAGVLMRLVRLLEYPDAALVRGVRRVLGPLRASELLPRIESIPLDARRSLGAWVKIIDPEATDHIREALRHPVLTRRLNAIAMADALDAVDRLGQAFVHVARDDHQEARMRAADAMSRATSRQTLEVLGEMLTLPSCPVRDAAVAALRVRQQSFTGDRS